MRLYSVSAPEGFSTAMALIFLRHPKTCSQPGSVFVSCLPDKAIKVL